MFRSNKFHSFMRASTMLGIIMMPTLAGTVFAQGKGVDKIAAQGSWTVKPMASNTNNAYCALSRPYEGDLILTLGRSQLEEYSLAIDFLDASLNVNRAYDVTLQPGPGQIRAYEMMPASARAMVVRIGFDDSFMETLEQSGALKAEIEGQVYNFEISDFAKARRDLKVCMQRLSKDTVIKTAENKFKAQKIENAPPVDAPKLKPAMKPEPAAPKFLQELDVQEVQKVVAKPPQDIEAVPQKAVKIERVPRPPSTISRAVENVPSVAPVKAAAKPIVINKVSSQVIDMPEADDLSAQKERAEALMKAQADAAKKVKERAEVIAVQKQAQEEEQDRLAQRAQEKQEEQKREAERLAAAQKKETLEIERLKAEKEKQRQIAEQKAQELQKFKQQTERLKQAMDEQEEKLALLDQKKPDAQDDVEEIQARMKALEEENRSLYLEARKARAEIDTAVVNTSNQALAKMREYEEKLEAARADNLALSKEMEEIRLLKEEGRLENVAGGWDLEKSTSRYNEAEREIKRLGLLLEQQRTAHRREKAELEQMLFDPAVTDKEQRRRLVELELQLEAAQRKLADSGQQVRDIRAGADMPAVPAPRVARVSAAERVGLHPLASIKPSPSGAIMADIREEQAALNRLNDSIRQQKSEVIAAPDFPRIEDTPTRISSTPRAPENPSAVRSSISPSPVGNPQAERVSHAVESRHAPVRDPVAPVRTMFDARKLSNILKSAGVTLSGNVNQVGLGQYQWILGQLKGQAQVVPITQTGGLDPFIANFMAHSQQKCAGDFASLPAPDVTQGRAFEVACISPNSNLSSSLIFLQRGAEVIVIGHEISADDMDIAMDVRDRIAGKL